MLSEQWQSKLKLSGIGNECKSLPSMTYHAPRQKDATPAATATCTGRLPHGVTAQVEFESKVWRRFTILYFQALLPLALSSRVLILSTCTALPRVHH
jgi:hypothetical protein